MIKLFLDFETYSESDINKTGAFKYVDHPSTTPLCLSYKINNERTQIWTANSVAPQDLRDAVETVLLGQGDAYAFNATFDLLVWNKKFANLYDMPQIPLEHWRDVQALCARFKLPQNLMNAGRVLKCSIEKMAVGKRLINKCCKPNGNPTAQDFTDLYQYCIVDTDVLAEIVSRLPADHLTDLEQLIWELTYQMNERGVPIDIEANDAIIRYLKIYMETMKAVLPEVTNGLVTAPSQTLRMKKFCESKSVVLPNMKAGTIVETLKRDDLPEDVRTVLQLRAELGLSSVKKFLTIKEMYNNGVVQGNLNYHGAGTGRFAGRGLQYHNLPRAKVSDPDSVINAFIAKEPIEDPVGKAKALIRSMITASDGETLLITDYSSIENRVLAWFAGDEKTLQGFREDFDQYKDMACFLYNKKLEDVVKSERQLGKAIILGCGFGMGHKRFKEAAESYGVYLDLAGAKFAVDGYRRKYHMIVKMWYRLADTVKNAVKWPGKTYTAHKCSCRVVKDRVGTLWLRITLPSGRALMYNSPRLTDDKYGACVSYSGINPTTYQWATKKLTPGLITENVVQALARDFLTHGMLKVDQEMPEVKLILCVHDEIGVTTKVTDHLEETLEKLNEKFCDMPDWCAGMPLKAEGYISRRYKKD